MSTQSVGIIMSAAYVTAELQAEFGLLPPAYLPVGAKRLYWWQITELKKYCDRVIITLPESFRPAAHDLTLINKLGAEIQPVPDGVSIGQSLLYALNILSLSHSALTVLHGDTLIKDLPALPENMVTLHQTNAAYTWATMGKPQDSNHLFNDVALQSSAKGHHNVLSGMFAFSDTAPLIRALTKQNGHFLNALELYHNTHPLAAVTTGDWLDFGHMQTYQNSRKAMTTERAFNTLQIEGNRVSKLSRNSFKMDAEASWFEQIPAALRLYTPPILGRVSRNGMQGYTTGYQPLTPLNDLLVFGALGRPAWSHIMTACADFLASARSAYDPALDTNPVGIDQLLLSKTLVRLAQFNTQTGISTSDSILVNGTRFPSLAEMAHQSFARIGKDDSAFRTVMHGDFCFSNIMYDSRSSKISVIDPRGYLQEGKTTIFGDIRYDIAKLYHSAIGKYDFIVSGYAASTRHAPHDYSFELDAADFGTIAESAFLDTDFCAIAPAAPDIAAIAVHLFLSMLPLHADNPARQMALMLNATRIYGKMGGTLSAAKT